MSNPEFSQQFDVLYDNASNQAPGQDEYEKSVYLTKAQDEILKSYFNARLNKAAEGFDESEKRQIDFSNLISLRKLDRKALVTAPENLDYRGDTVKVDLNKKDDNNEIFIVLNEFVTVARNPKYTTEGVYEENSGTTITLSITPIDYREYSKMMLKPYRRPFRNQAWRLLEGATDGNQVELVLGPNDYFKSYTVRYLRRPNPIILCDLKSMGLTIDGKDSVTECEVNPILHQEILQRAVELASIPKDTNQKLQAQLGLGMASQTELGGR